MNHAVRAFVGCCAVIALGYAVACGGGSQQSVAQPTVVPSSPTPSPTPSPPAPGISTDAELFTLVTRTDPFGSYSLFPNVDPINFGAPFHPPADRVRLNATALAALSNGRLAPGTRFPDRSVIFKEILTNGTATSTLYSLIYKDAANPLAANGWLWAEFTPGGTPSYSITNRGAVCTSCHSSGQGQANDFVRTFERQH